MKVEQPQSLELDNMSPTHTISTVRWYTQRSIIHTCILVIGQANPSLYQVLIYTLLTIYVSKSLKSVELNYPLMEKTTLILIISARWLQSYFQAYSIQVITDNLIKYVLSKPNHFGRLLKWLVELTKFDISYSHGIAIRLGTNKFSCYFSNSLNIPIN